MRALMYPPLFYGIEYEINPWMDRKRQPDSSKAWDQWEHLRSTYEEVLGWEVFTGEPKPGLPDMVFPANACVISGNIAVLSRFRHQERQWEAPYYKEKLEELGYTVSESKETFEGQGDILPWGDTLICGYGIRSREEGVRSAAGLMGFKETVFLRLGDEKFYHLDTCFCPAGQVALYYPPAFSKISRHLLCAGTLGSAIEVNREDAENLICNSVYGKKDGNQYLIIPSEPSKSLRRVLEKINFTIIVCDASEFALSGGGPRCMTLFLD